MCRKSEKQLTFTTTKAEYLLGSISSCCSGNEPHRSLNSDVSSKEGPRERQKSNLKLIYLLAAGTSHPVVIEISELHSDIPQISVN